MDKYLKEQFSPSIKQLITDHCEQDHVVRDILYFMSKNRSEQITVAVLEKNIQTVRRVGMKNGKGKIYTYKNESTYISRAKAERVVEKLVFAGLVTTKYQLPLKLLEITVRGMQVVIELKEREMSRQNNKKEA